MASLLPRTRCVSHNTSSSLTLFAIYINDLLTIIHPQYYFYAEDSLTFSTPDKQDAIIKLQEDNEKSLLLW